MRPTFSFSASVLALAAAVVLGQPTAGMAQTDLTGTWDAYVDTNQGSGEVTLELTQVGDSISGTYLGTFGQTALNGEVEGANVTLRVPVVDETGLLGLPNGTILFQGTVELDGSMSGSYDLEGLLVGTFQAAKRSDPAAPGG